MQRLRLFTACVLLALPGFAQTDFPGLQKLMSETEWKRAGLDKLTPDQIGVIDAALIRYYVGEIRAAQANTAGVTPPAVQPGASPVEAAVARARFWDKFGLGKLTSGDWRKEPPMTAKVTSWLGANRFSLDTGQVWEGAESIPYEILGKDITIYARPMGSFVLKLTEDSLEVRVRRVR